MRRTAPQRTDEGIWVVKARAPVRGHAADRSGPAASDEDAPSPKDDGRAEEDDRSAYPVEPVRLLPINSPAPEHCPNEEDAGVRGEEPPVAIFGLERLDDRVAEECGGADESEERRRVGAKPAPDRVGAAEFAENRDEEDAERLENSDRGTSERQLDRSRGRTRRLGRF